VAAIRNTANSLSLSLAVSDTGNAALNCKDFQGKLGSLISNGSDLNPVDSGAVCNYFLCVCHFLTGSANRVLNHEG